MHLRTVLLTGLVLSVSACGGAGPGGSGKGAALPPAQRSGNTSASGAEISKAAAQGYKDALATFVAHDKAYDWSEQSCKSTADAFVSASKQQASDSGKPLPEALYNAGLAYMRCGQEAAALAQFQEALKAGKGFHRARGQIALFEFKKTKDLNGTISNLEGIIRDAKFQNVEALVSLAALQMERGGNEANQDGANDFERAKKNIQRSLAIDDSFMPAFNQLAIYYMEEAKRKAEGGGTGSGRRERRGLVVAGAQKAKVNRQQLDLAALVAGQGARKSPNYAPIHNTAGLIQVELANYNNAVTEFGRARQLDPSFFEAHMNYAAVSLSFRGFKEAEAAYRDALKLSPNDYEAHLGLALALRGQINDANYDNYLAEAKKHLAECKKLDGKRPEAYYNEAILTQEYEAKGGDSAKSVPTLKEAARKYGEFIEKASGNPTYAEAVKRSKDRAQDIQDTIKFIEEGEKVRVEQEEVDKAAAKAAAEQGQAAPPAEGEPAPAPK